MKKIDFKVVLGLCIIFFITINSMITGEIRMTISRDEVSDESKVKNFVNWWIQGDKFVKSIKNRSTSIIFNEGFCPKIIGKNPWQYKNKYKNLSEWFIAKIYLDLQELKNYEKKEFKKFVDTLAEDTSILVGGEIAYKYNLNFENFIYEVELRKIPTEEERKTFKKYYLDDIVISSEARILGWLYYEWFGEKYKPTE